jgi:iron complex outermembrane recepter protein
VKNFQIFCFLCLVGSASLLTFQSAQATEKPSTQAADLLAQTTELASPIKVTGVRINPTATGIEVILQTDQGKTIQPEIRSGSNTTFLAEIPNAVLALPGSSEFRAENPSKGIQSVTVTQLEGNVILVQAVGDAAVPIVMVKTEPNLTAEEPDTGEEEVVVTGDRAPSYRVPNSSTATGTDTPILETPFSVQVVPKEVIRDQQATSVEEALQNVSGITYSGSDGGRDTNIGIRGFGTGDVSIPLLRDGFRQYGTFQGIPEVANLEKIEVLKGPSSILYGQIEPGGILNLVLKKPLPEPFYELELQAGSQNRVQPRIDFNGPLTADGKVLARLSALYKHEDSFRGFDTPADRFSIAPSLTWKISDRTKVDFSLEYVRDSEPADFGITRFGTGVAPIPRNRPINNPDDSVTANFLSLGYTFEHEFNDNWKIRNGFRYLRYTYDYSVLALPFIVNDAEVTRFYADQDGEANSYSLYTNIIGKFSTGSIKHTLTAGIDLNRTDDRILTLFDIANPSTINIFDPDYNLVPKPLRADLPPFADTKVISKRLGVYIQDQVRLLDNLILVAGVRYDTITQKTSNIQTDFVAGGETTQADSAFTPRLGLIYQPIKEVSLFANYSQSFNPSTRTTFLGTPLGAERGEGFEFGVKTELLNQKLLATLSYFNITKNNVAASDPNFPLFSIPVGQQRSQGIELDVAGEILPGWKIIGSYAYTDAKVSKDTNLDNIGKRLSGVAEHSMSLWTTYEIQKGTLKGLGFGAGLNYVGNRFGDVANTFEIGDYLIGNAAIFYTRDRYRFALNFKNIANANYIKGSTGNEGGIDPGEPFTVIGSFSVKF